MNSRETELRLMVLAELKKAGEPVKKDDLARRCGLTTREANSVMSKMERDGLITVGCSTFGGGKTLSYGTVRLAERKDAVDEPERPTYRMDWTPVRPDAEEFKRQCFSRRGDVRIPLANIRPIGMQSTKPHDHHLRDKK